MGRTTAQIQSFLDDNMHRFDLGVQFLGSEPNAVRRDWDTATARWCLVASWPYEAAAGNQSIPAVYKSIHDADPTFLCDRFYLPATPGDMKLLEKNNIPVFGIESKHQLTDFDVVATSISYPVLSMSFVKMLTMSGINARWKQRDPNTTPMIMVGGLSYGAPEVLAPVVDCWFLGECEDEPGNPGIGAVTARIAAFKRLGLWTTDRLACYSDLAREFNFLYFPRFVDVTYDYEDRQHVGVGPRPSKQVIGYTSNLDGMRLPLRKRHVKNLDAIPPLDNPPLLYSDPAMGCLTSENVVLTGDGPRRVGQLWLDQKQGPVPVQVAAEADKLNHVHAFVDTGPRSVVTVTLESGHRIRATPDHLVQVVTGELVNVQGKRSRKAPLNAGEFDQTRDRHATLDDLPRQWVEASKLADGPYHVPVHYGQNHWSSCQVALDTNFVPRDVPGGFEARIVRLPDVLDEDVARFLGYFGTDGRHHENLAIGFSSDDAQPELRERYVDLLERLFGLPVTVKKVSANTATVTVASVAVQWWLEANFVIEDLETRRGQVPEAIFRSPRSVVAAYLSAVFDADGDVSIAYEGTPRQIRRSPRIASTREQFAQDATVLLNNIGVPTTIHAETAPGRAKMRSGPANVVTCFRVGLRSATDADFGWLVPWEPTKAKRLEAWLKDRKMAPGFRNGLAFSRVKSVQDVAEKKWCWDLQVPGDRRFVCNGMVVHNSGDLEVARSCPAWCSFCALAWRSKPYRQRSVDYVVKYAKKLQDNLGSTRMAPFSPDLPMHTQRRRLITELLEKVSDEVDAASMRVDDFIADDTFILLQVHGGMDAVTLGVEGNSQRMRDLVGKGTADADVHEALTRGIRAGVRKFKLFMISNLPGEDEGDVYRILKLAKDLADIRESMNQPTVRIQFSWTPLMIEANTPFQWFAPQPASRVLGDVWEEFRDLKIDFKLGAKGEQNKLAFFQLCQRASREVGEALLDAMLEVDQACWGGVPRTFKDLIETKLHDHGFHNGYADCFDERFKNDMFGWEFIDQGISSELLWQTYVQMREFVEQTDSHTYDMNFDSAYHGAEWVARCDEKCQGKTCGVCDHTDLKYRNNYIRAAQTDIDVDLSTVKSVDQHSQTIRIRAKISKPASLRFVGNDHWRFLFRRACFRAQTTLDLPYGVSKRSIRFASDEVKYRDWTAGVDYVEFAMTRHMTDHQIRAYLDQVDVHLEGRMRIHGWTRHPADAVSIRTDVDLTLFDVELDADPDLVTQRLRWWRQTPHIPMRLKIEGGYFAPNSEQVNARDYVDDIWAVQAQHSLHVRALVRGRPNPYNIVAALMGKPSWLPYARYAATRMDSFIAIDRTQQDFLRPVCQRCGLGIPINLLDQPFEPSHCPHCFDIVYDIAVKELTP